MKSFVSIRATADRWLSLLFAPLTISLVTIIVTNLALFQAIPWWLWLSSLLSLFTSIFLYFIAYHTTFDRILNGLSKRLRIKRYQRPNVLILDGTINGEPQETRPVPVYSNRTPTDWKTALAALQWTIDLGPMKTVTNRLSPDIVINPFGELYPEADFITNKTFSQIRDYVWNGGVFVSVAGAPFWYRYNPTIGFREDSGRVKAIINNIPYWKPLINDLFPNLTPRTEPLEVNATQQPIDIERFGDIASSGGSTAITSFRAYPINPPQLIPIIRDQNNNICVIGAYQYGQGAFIFAGVAIADAPPTFEKVIAAIKGWSRYEAKGRTP